MEEVCSEHRHTLAFRHRYLLWGTLGLAVLCSLPLFIAGLNARFLYQIAIGAFLFYGLMDFLEAKSLKAVRVYPKRITVGDTSVSYESIKYVHGQAAGENRDISKPVKIIIVYGERSQLFVSTNIPGFQKIVASFHAHNIPTNLK